MQRTARAVIALLAIITICAWLESYSCPPMPFSSMGRAGDAVTDSSRLAGRNGKLGQKIRVTPIAMRFAPPPVPEWNPRKKSAQQIHAADPTPAQESETSSSGELIISNNQSDDREQSTSGQPALPDVSNDLTQQPDLSKRSDAEKRPDVENCSDVENRADVENRSESSSRTSILGPSFDGSRSRNNTAPDVPHADTSLTTQSHSIDHNQWIPPRATPIVYPTTGFPDVPRPSGTPRFGIENSGDAGSGMKNSADAVFGVENSGAAVSGAATSNSATFRETSGSERSSFNDSDRPAETWGPLQPPANRAAEDRIENQRSSDTSSSFTYPSTDFPAGPWVFGPEPPREERGTENENPLESGSPAATDSQRSPHSPSSPPLSAPQYPITGYGGAPVPSPEKVVRGLSDSSTTSQPAVQLELRGPAAPGELAGPDVQNSAAPQRPNIPTITTDAAGKPALSNIGSEVPSIDPVHPVTDRPSGPAGSGQPGSTTPSAERGYVQGRGQQRTAADGKGATGKSTSSELEAALQLANPFANPRPRRTPVAKPQESTGSMKPNSESDPAVPANDSSFIDEPTIENSDAMRAVTQQSNRLVEKGFSLASRNAVYSARAEFIAALRMLTEAYDAITGNTEHSQALNAGLVALREADDLVSGYTDIGVDVQRIVETHKTPVLQDDKEDVSLLTARQRYYTFAQNKLSEACENNPVASRALYGLGKLNSWQVSEAKDTMMIRGPKAVVFHRAAIAVNPGNVRAANELGVLLAKYGALDHARGVLLQAISVQPSPELWHNLAAVHDRLGQQQLADQARREQRLAERDMNSRMGASNLGTPIRWVDASAFARMSQNSIAPSAPISVQPPQSARQESQQATDRGGWKLPWK